MTGPISIVTFCLAVNGFSETVGFHLNVTIKLHCDCNPDPSNAYIGYTTRRIDQRMKEHAGYVRRGEDSSGIAQHLNHGCNGPVDFSRPEILARVQCRSKKQADYLLKIREGMEIRCHQTGPGKGLNDNWGNLPTRQWDPLFAEIRRRRG